MKIARLGTYFALSAFGLLLAAVGCEAIVSNDVPAYTCSTVAFVDPGTGACPAGMYCEGAGCIACNPPGDDPCDGYDNDCDGKIDDGPKSDHDGDGYTVCGKIDANGATTALDCNDNDKTISPAGTEVCNGKDDNCDGIIDNPSLVCKPGFTCVPTTGACISNTETCTTANCPAPKQCDPKTQQCVLPDSQDAGTTCTSSEQCTTGICAGTSQLGDAGAAQVCTKPCCTSADCSEGDICYGAGQGGNYCLQGVTVGRATLGGNVPGAACTSNADCRSGVCTANVCEDTCCSTTNCTGNTQCTATTFAGNVTLACVPPAGTSPTNATCRSSSDCASGYCAGYIATNGFGTTTVFACAQPCCSSKQCGSLEDNQLVCFDDFYPPPSPTQPAPTSGPVVPVCDAPQQTTTSHGNPVTPTGQVGDSCTKTTDCFSNRCLIFTAGQFCSDVCCQDSDCGKAGWVCHPFPDGPGTYLRCVPSGT